MTLQWRVFGRDLAEHVHLVSRQSAERHLDSNHLFVGLSLAVYTLLKPERHEFGFRKFATPETFYLELEILDLVGKDREDALAVGIGSPAGLLSLSSQLILPGSGMATWWPGSTGIKKASPV